MNNDNLYKTTTEALIGAAIQVHKELGPGLLESAYQHCLSKELEIKGIQHQSQLQMPVKYKGKYVECGYRIDILIPEVCIMELKSVQKLDPIHEAQLLTYMKLSGVRCGLLINFNVTRLIDGIKRMVL